jgi:hypothetical protein
MTFWSSCNEGVNAVFANPRLHLVMRSDLSECGTNTQTVRRPEPAVENPHTKYPIPYGRLGEFCCQRSPNRRRIAKSDF